MVAPSVLRRRVAPGGPARRGYVPLSERDTLTHMVEVGTAAPAAAVDEARAPLHNVRVRFVGVVVLAAFVVALVQLPSAVRRFDRRASFNAHQSRIGETIAGADGVAIDNAFVIRALSLVPVHATYTLGMPESPKVAATYGIVPTTLLALPNYVRFLVLPRREADPSEAQYLLCYACDTSPFDKRMQRLWTDPKGFVIGKLRA
jgi:hypothetical protein